MSSFKPSFETQARGNISEGLECPCPPEDSDQELFVNEIDVEGRMLPDYESVIGLDASRACDGSDKSLIRQDGPCDNARHPECMMQGTDTIDPSIPLARQGIAESRALATLTVETNLDSNVRQSAVSAAALNLSPSCANTVTQPQRRKRRDSRSMPFSALPRGVVSRQSSPGSSRASSRRGTLISENCTAQGTIGSTGYQTPQSRGSPADSVRIPRSSLLESAQVAGDILVNGVAVGGWRDRLSAGSATREAGREAKKLMAAAGALEIHTLASLQPLQLPYDQVASTDNPLPEVPKAWLTHDCRRWPRHLKSLGVFAHPVGAWCLRAGSFSHRRSQLHNFQAAPSDFLRLMGNKRMAQTRHGEHLEDDGDQLLKATGRRQREIGSQGKIASKKARPNHRRARKLGVTLPASGAGDDGPVLLSLESDEGGSQSGAEYSCGQESDSESSLSSSHDSTRVGGIGLGRIRRSTTSVLDRSNANRATGGTVVAQSRLQSALAPSTVASVRAFMRLLRIVRGGLGAKLTPEQLARKVLVRFIRGIRQRILRQQDEGSGDTELDQEGKSGNGHATGGDLVVCRRAGQSEAEDRTIDTNTNLKNDFERHERASELGQRQHGHSMESGADADISSAAAVDDIERRLVGLLAQQEDGHSPAHEQMEEHTKPTGLRRVSLLGDHTTRGVVEGHAAPLGNPIIMQKAAMLASSTVTLITGVGDRLIEIVRETRATIGNRVSQPLPDPAVIAAAQFFGGSRDITRELRALRGASNRSNEFGNHRVEEQVNNTLKLFGALAEASRDAAAAIAGFSSYGAMVRQAARMYKASPSNGITDGEGASAIDPFCVGMLSGIDQRCDTQAAGQDEMQEATRWSGEGRNRRSGASTPSRDHARVEDEELRLAKRERELLTREEDLRQKEAEAEERIARTLLQQKRELMQQQDIALRESQRLRDRTAEVEREGAAELRRRLKSAEVALATAEAAQHQSMKEVQARMMQAKQMEASLVPREQAIEIAERRVLARWTQAQRDIGRQMQLLQVAEGRLMDHSQGGVGCFPSSSSHRKDNAADSEKFLAGQPASQGAEASVVSARVQSRSPVSIADPSNCSMVREHSAIRLKEALKGAACDMRSPRTNYVGAPPLTGECSISVDSGRMVAGSPGAPRRKAPRAPLMGHMAHFDGLEEAVDDDPGDNKDDGAKRQTQDFLVTYLDGHKVDGISSNISQLSGIDSMKVAERLLGPAPQVPRGDAASASGVAVAVHVADHMTHTEASRRQQTLTSMTIESRGSFPQDGWATHRISGQGTRVLPPRLPRFKESPGKDALPIEASVPQGSAGPSSAAARLGGGGLWGS